MVQYTKCETSGGALTVLALNRHKAGHEGLRIKGVPIPESKVSQLNEVKWP